MKPRPWHILLGFGLFPVAMPHVWGQAVPRIAEIGYVCPAGGCQGTTFQVVVGGQFLNGSTDVLFSGKGLQGTVVKYSPPLTQKQMNEIREKLEEARERLQTEIKNGNRPAGQAGFQIAIRKIVLEMGVRQEDLSAFDEFRRNRNDPKYQPNPQMGELVTLQVTIDPATNPGKYELRLWTASGLSNPVRFFVGQYPEYLEMEPNDRLADIGIQDSLPCVVNGQILPGDVDRFRFKARKGYQLVAAVRARQLIPYLADAVPGWFQGVLTLYDADGKEIAYSDDFRFDPDPVLVCQIPKDGHYILEMKDAIYRGREDFVYRLTLGEIPLVTSIFPLGGHAGDATIVELTGWNLPTDRLIWESNAMESQVHAITQLNDVPLCNPVSFAVDTRPNCLEKEPNNCPEEAQQVEFPQILNGRMDYSGDWDIFRFQCRSGEILNAEIMARRLGWPLDSILKLTDASGQLLGTNDDHEDPGAGLLTHHADSRFSVTIPKDGFYYLFVGDTQKKGGPAYGYRLYLNGHEPDFALRVVPSTLNVRAGETIPITVYALRKNGFQGDIRLTLENPPPKFMLSGGRIPAGTDKVRLTLTIPPTPLEKPCRISLVGQSEVNGRTISRQAIPADDRMQAFFYRHLVPADALVVATMPGRRFRGPMRLAEQQPVKFSAGKTADVQIAMAGRPIPNQIQLVLNEPPDGITIQKMTPIPTGVAIQFHAEPHKVQSGLKGNLIVDAFTERTTQGRNQRIQIGTLPAIPFEIE
ncbi:MAG: hypothetical protein JW829_03870 [Pirellulales bacterium]|nr:hypothetical protein [Pirellulales bacterium]